MVKPCSGMRSKSPRTITWPTTTSASPSTRKAKPTKRSAKSRKQSASRPDDADAHKNLGVALDKKGQTDEAIRQYQEAIRLKPGDADAHNNLGIALTRKAESTRRSANSRRPSA